MEYCIQINLSGCMRIPSLNCLNITKEFDDIASQRVGFILRNLNDDTDYLLVEEKPGVKGVKKDIGKGKALQMAMLQKWTHFVGSVRISNLEAIICQWQDVKLKIIGTKYLSQSHSISYNKGVFFVPKIINNLASFAQTLAAVLFLKRLFMQFKYNEADDNILLRSDSIAGYNSSSDQQGIDSGLEEDIAEAIQDIKRDNDTATVKD